MGGVTSKVTHSDIEHVLLNIMDRSTENCNAVQDSEMDFILRAGNNVTLTDSDISSDEIMNITCMMTNLNKTDFKNGLKEDLKAFAKTKGVAVLSALSKNATTAIDDFANNVTSKIKSINTEEFKTYLNTKLLININAKENIIIHDLHIVDKRKMVLQELVKHADLKTDIVTVNQELNEHLDSSENDLITKGLTVIKNLFSNPIFIMGLVAVAIVAVLVLIKFGPMLL
jgi:hypothetical protein